MPSVRGFDESPTNEGGVWRGGGGFDGDDESVNFK